MDGDGSTTTGDVAGYLEDEYHVMRTFLELNEDFIKDAITDQFAGMIESMSQGRPVAPFNLGFASGKIEERFRNFLDSGEMNTLIGSHAVSDKTLKTSSRRKSGKLPEGQQRQAFVDTGLYSASFRVWLSK